jgi:serine/threonine protein kinase
MPLEIDPAAEPLPHAWVVDFGLAEQQTVQTSLSASGQVVGTPAFMPPEQALGEARSVGPLSDVYSLGATLYHAVAGVPPFQEQEILRLLERVVNDDPPPPRRFNPAAPRDVQTIVQRAIPAGAVVTVDGEHVGTTPCEARVWPRGR